MGLFNWTESQYFLFYFVFVRVSALLVFLPLLGDRMIPAQLKALFALALAYILTPLVFSQGIKIMPQMTQNSASLIYFTLLEAFLGILIGYVARWVFDAIQFAGHFISSIMGFSSASLFDPNQETQVTAISELTYLLTALLFLALDGHHLYLKILFQSFEMLPLGKFHFYLDDPRVLKELLAITANVIELACKFSAPMIIVTFLMNFTFGILSKAVPQLNVLAISFGANICIGLAVLLLSLPHFTAQVNSTFDVYLPSLFHWMRTLGG